MSTDKIIYSRTTNRFYDAVISLNEKHDIYSEFKTVNDEYQLLDDNEKEEMMGLADFCSSKVHDFYEVYIDDKRVNVKVFQHFSLEYNMLVNDYQFTIDRFCTRYGCSQMHTLTVFNLLIDARHVRHYAMFNFVFYVYFLRKFFKFSKINFQDLRHKDVILHSDHISMMQIKYLGGFSNFCWVSSYDECCVCFEPTTSTTACKHSVCDSCLYKLKEKVCPMCRASICFYCVDEEEDY
jgi:hypothetical protein